MQSSEETPLRQAVWLSANKIASQNKYEQTLYSRLNVATLEQLARVVTSRCWSPIVYQGEYRAGKNFESCGLVVFDFDSGEWTLEKAGEFCKENNLAHIIGLSKSHQKPKKVGVERVAPPCDRFRLILLAERSQTNADAYVHHMNLCMNVFPADSQCKDKARFFYPCTGIWSIGDGRYVKWKDFDADEMREERKSQALKRLKERARIQATGKLPMYLEKIIMQGAPEGRRHAQTFRIGCIIAELDLNKEEITNLILSKSPLAEIGEQDVRRAIDNGYAKGKV